jgi:hypothetical protein
MLPTWLGIVLLIIIPIIILIGFNARIKTHSEEEDLP